MIYSFDVFDTLITRKTASPEGIFALMQEYLCSELQEEHLIPKEVCRSFCVFRKGAEKLSRDPFGCFGRNEISLQLIYEAMGMHGNLSEEAQQFLIELEKQTELDNCVGIQENIDRLFQYREEGHTVLMISDMYLESEMIRKMLIKADARFADVPLFVSSDFGLLKWNGKLYEHVRKLMQLNGEWVHIGDNIRSDVQIPRRQGIASQEYPQEMLLEYEECFLQKYPNDVQLQRVVGASRNARRVRRTAEAGKVSTAFQIGSSIGGAVLFPYVAWILEESRKRGIKRLYFIARDGYVLKKIADIVIGAKHYEIETKYIYGSRKAWRLPSMDGTSENLRSILRWSCPESLDNLEALCSFFDVEEEELLAFMPSLSYSKGAAWEKEISFPIHEQFYKCPEFIKYIYEKQQEKRELCLDYFRQELNLADENFAFVELGGTGFTQGCLANLLSGLFDGRIKTFFYKMEVPGLVWNCDNYIFLPDFSDKHVLLEMFCRAPHGQADGYCRRNGQIEPVLAEFEDKALMEHGFSEYVEGVLEYSRQYLDNGNASAYAAEYLEIPFLYLDYVKQQPADFVLDFFGGMPNNLTGREKKVQEFAPVLSRKDLRRIYLFRTNEFLETVYTGSCLEYSLLRCSKKMLRMKEFYQRLHDTKYGKVARGLAGGRRKRKDRINDIYDMLGQKLVIYGAGKRGNLFYQQMTGQKRRKGKRYRKEIVLWVDRDYQKYAESEQRVVPPEQILNVQYEQVIIAVQNKNVAEDIRTTLLEMGVLRTKIIWINPSAN